MKKENWLLIGSLAGVLALIILMNQLLVSQLSALPSPLYGGDYYHQLGATNHIKYGGNPLSSPNMKGSSPVYMVLYSSITGTIARVFGIEGIASEFIFSYVIVILSGIIIYFLILTFIKEPLIAALGVLAFISPLSMPVLKYTDMAHFVTMPLMILLAYRFLEHKTLKRGALLGLVYGLIGLNHSVAFMSASLFLAAIFIYYGVFLNIEDFRKKEWKKIFIDNLLPFMVVFAIGVSIALLWWFKPIFYYHGQTSAYYTEWNNGDWSRIGMQMAFLWNVLKSSLFDFSTLSSGLLSIFSWAGIIGLFSYKKGNRQTRFISFSIIAAAGISFHYLLTQNIFGFNLIPSYIPFLLLDPLKLLLFSFGVYFVITLIGRINANKKIIRIIQILFVSLLIALFISAQVSAYKQRSNDQWFNAGKNALPAHLTALKEYLVENSDVNDVIIATNENSFAINALTGRKMVISRRAHVDPFLDMNSRELDAAVIFYGNSTGKKLELLKKYDVKYLYWDYYWIQSEYYVNEQGQVTGWFDPITIFYSADAQKALEENNVSFVRQTTWVDPALKGDDFKQFDLLFVSPQNYRTAAHPWSYDLDPYLEEIWNHTQGEIVIARLYKVNTNLED